MNRDGYLRYCLNSLLEGWALLLAYCFTRFCSPGCVWLSLRFPCFFWSVALTSLTLLVTILSLSSSQKGHRSMLPCSQLCLLRVSGAGLYFLTWGGACPRHPLFPGDLKNLVHEIFPMDVERVGHRDVVQPLV